MTEKPRLNPNRFLPLALATAPQVEKLYFRTGEKLRELVAFNHNILEDWTTATEVANELLTSELKKLPLAQGVGNGLISFYIAPGHSTGSCQSTEYGFNIRFSVNEGLCPKLLFSNQAFKSFFQSGTWMLCFHELAHCLPQKKAPEGQFPKPLYSAKREERHADAWGMAGALYRVGKQDPADLMAYQPEKVAKALSFPEILNTKKHLKDLAVLKRAVQKNLHKIQAHTQKPKHDHDSNSPSKSHF